MAKTEIIGGVVVTMPDRGTHFGGPTIADRILDDEGKIKQDTIPLTYGGVLTVPAGSDNVDGNDEIETTGVTVTPAAPTVAVDATVALTATLTPSGSVDPVKWSSDNEDIATVSATGVVTGVAVGSAVITATSGFEGDNVTVTVTPAA